MSSEPLRARKAVTLLATTLFLVFAASFHSRADNDLARACPGPAPAGFATPSGAPVPDTCAACALDGVLLARLALSLPVEVPLAAGRLVPPIPENPFVSPRASVDSRPPPAIL